MSKANPLDQLRIVKKNCTALGRHSDIHRPSTIKLPNDMGSNVHSTDVTWLRSFWFLTERVGNWLTRIFNL